MATDRKTYAAGERVCNVMRYGTELIVFHRKRVRLRQLFVDVSKRVFFENGLFADNVGSRG